MARMPVITTNVIKVKKIIFAISAAPEAISVKPNKAATSAMTRNMAVHFIMISYFLGGFLFYVRGGYWLHLKSVIPQQAHLYQPNLRCVCRIF